MTLPPDNPAPARRLWVTLPAGAFVLLVLLALVFGEAPQPGGRGTSHDASKGGFRAAYLLLEGLKYPVERSRRPTGAAVRWVLLPREAPARDVAPLVSWVRQGGLLLLATDHP